MVPQIEFPSASRFLTGTTNSCTEAVFTSSCPRGKHVCPPTQAADHTHTSAGSVALSASFLQAIVASIKTETVQQQTPAEGCVHLPLILICRPCTLSKLVRSTYAQKQHLNMLKV